MTAKRFKEIYPDIIRSNYCFTDNGKPIGGKEVCDQLNEQHETIQRLKQNITELLSVNVEEDLLKENEQLKNENYELHKRLGDFEPFERHIEERTSKTSLEDIIGIVKTDEPTNSVELKKELYK